MGNSSQTSKPNGKEINPKYNKFFNKLDLNHKYKFKNKIYRKTRHQKTIQIYDMVFRTNRILKQVLSLTSTTATSCKRPPSKKSRS